MERLRGRLSELRSLWDRVKNAVRFTEVFHGSIRETLNRIDSALTVGYTFDDLVEGENECQLVCL